MPRVRETILVPRSKRLDRATPYLRTKDQTRSGRSVHRADASTGAGDWPNKRINRSRICVCEFQSQLRVQPNFRPGYPGRSAPQTEARWWSKAMSSASTQRPAKLGYVISVAIGLFGGATLFALAGSITDRAVSGGICGAAIGGFAGWGWRAGLISSAVVWICCFAVAGAFIGPSYDADSLSSALVYGALGAWIGYLRWRGFVALLGALITINIHPALCALFLLFTGLYFAWEFFAASTKQPVPRPPTSLDLSTSSWRRMRWH